MPKMWEVFAQSSEPEAHVNNARQTKDTKQDKNNVNYAYTNTKNVTVKYIVIKPC